MCGGGFVRVVLGITFVLFVNFNGQAQDRLISTIAGPLLPVDGSLAISQGLNPTGVAPAPGGGFYLASGDHNRIYRVAADGRLWLVAGSGFMGNAGDGGPAASSKLNSPQGIAVDSKGNLYIADYANHAVRRIDPTGVIQTAAGNGTAGFSGDGGPATSAQLNHPYDVAVDSAGNLWIADRGNFRIRRVDPAGIISTVAGNGTSGYSGDGGPANSAQLSTARDVAVDSAGILYIADTNNHRVRRVDPAGVISTVAGNGTSDFSGDGGPAASAGVSAEGVGVDAGGNLFIADGSRIRRVDSSGVITTVAGNGTSGWDGDGGPATSAQLNGAADVAVDSAGNLYIEDVRNQCIRRVDTAGIINRVAGNGTWGYEGDGVPANLARLYNVQSVAFDAAGNLYIADFSNSVVRLVDASGLIRTVAGTGTPGYSGDRGPATAAQLYGPKGVAVDATGNLYIVDSSYRVRRVDPSGVISTFAGNGSAGYHGDGMQAAYASLYQPSAVAVDSSGNVYIADEWNHRIRRVDSTGLISTVAGNSGYSGGYSGDGGPAIFAELNHPSGIAIDKAGNIFIADTSNHCIRRVDTRGIISTVAGDGTFGYSGDGGPAALAQLNRPSGVAVDDAGDLYISDAGNHRIRLLNAGGVISTVAGDGTSGFSGDGGPATSGQLNFPRGLAIDAAGDLLIADYSNHRIRKVTSGPGISMNFAAGAGGSATSSTAALNGPARTGYAAADISLGAVPYGTAVFAFKQNGVTVSEAGVPATPPTTAARVFIDYRAAAAAVPGRISSGTIDVKTGIAVVNCGSVLANVTYTLRDMAGVTLSIGHGTVAARAQFAKFIDQLAEMAPDFVLPSQFQTSVQFASLEISSDQPLSILALRMTTNQRNEMLFTPAAVADLSRPASGEVRYFPHFADGDGYTTSLILLNTSEQDESGTLRIRDNNGNPLVVNQAAGTAGSSFRYSIPKGGAVRFQTDGSAANGKTGWVQLTPDPGTATPMGAGLFGYNPGNYLLTESGMTAVGATTHARIYLDMSGGHNTALAIVNPTDSGASIGVSAFRTDGASAIGTSKEPLPLPAEGHDAKFADQLIAGLPAGFIGVLDVTSTTPFAALTMRSLDNERNDFIVATFPVADMTRGAPAPVVFPQIADGGGYATQFILIAAGGLSNVALNLYGPDGKPLPVGK